MRVLKYFFTALFSITIVAVVGFFVVREGLLILASRGVIDSLEVLKLYAQRDTASTECEILAGGETSDTPVEYQLRFTSSSDYVLEAICPLNRSNPIELGDNSLPMYVTKTPGKSGFVWAEGTSTGLEIEVFSEVVQYINQNFYNRFDPALIVRSRTIVVDDEKIETDVATLPETPGPTTSCEGFGYTCCDTITQVGEGDQLVGLSQCTDSCYIRCVDRPVVLSFNTNPFFDVETRQVEVESGMPVSFSYVANEKSAKNLTATIDFGDGETETANGSKGQVEHTYQCNAPFCNYEASILVEDENGFTSVDTAVTRLSIQVSR